IERRHALFVAARRAAGSFPHPIAFHVPGRIEVLGKHTDYAGGRSLLVATEQGFAVVAAARTDGRVRAIDASTGAVREASLDPDATGAAGDWENYLATVCRRFARDFGPGLVGADLAFASDLP